MTLVVFDLDGTLVDSRRDLAESANAVLAGMGVPPLPESAIGRMVGEGAAVLVARVFKAAGIDQPPDALERFLAAYDTRLLNHTRPYTGLVGVLEVLSPRAQLAVLTNKPLGPSRRILDGLQLAPFFQPGWVIGGDGPLPRKPDPSGLRALMTKAGVDASDAVLVGDSRIDWRTAQAAGSRACLVSWGFGFDSVPTDELQPPHVVAHTPADLLALL